MGVGVDVSQAMRNETIRAVKRKRIGLSMVAFLEKSDDLPLPDSASWQVFTMAA